MSSNTKEEKELTRQKTRWKGDREESLQTTTKLKCRDSATVLCAWGLQAGWCPEQQVHGIE